MKFGNLNVSRFSDNAFSNLTYLVIFDEDESREDICQVNFDMDRPAVEFFSEFSNPDFRCILDCRSLVESLDYIMSDFARN